MNMKLSMPEDVARAAGLSGNDADQKVTFLVLVELYREGKLSFGRLAELAGLPQAELMGRMAEHQAYLNYSPEDLAEDRKQAL